MVLGACTSQPLAVKEHITVAPIPSATLTCENEPSFPSNQNDAKQVANYIVGLWESWNDCYNKLNTVNRILSEQVVDVNK